LAEAASIIEPRFKENVEALKSVQPEDLSATEIDARLGACWIPPTMCRVFVSRVAGNGRCDHQVHHPAYGTWRSGRVTPAKATVANTKDWGTIGRPRLNSSKTRSISGRPPFTTKVRDGKSDKQVVNPAATEGAGKNSRRSKTVSSNGFGRMTNAGSGFAHKYNQEFKLRPSPRFQTATT